MSYIHDCTITILGKCVKVHYELLNNNLVTWDLARDAYPGTPSELLDIVEWTLRGTYSDHIARSCLEHSFYMSFHNCDETGPFESFDDEEPPF
jgi:hypothetical protein